MAAATAVLGAPERPAEEPPLPTAVVERITVRLVELSILALDRDEAPVAELGPDDLVLEVAGEEREIAFVRPFRPPHDPSRGRPSVRIGLETGGAASTAPTAPRYYLLLLDLGNEPVPKGSGYPDALTRFIREDLRDNDLVGLVSFTGTLNLEQAFTSDRDLQVDALARALSRSRPTSSNTRQRVQSLIRTLEQCEKINDLPWLTGEELDEAREAGEDRPVADESCVRGVATSYRNVMTGRGLRFLNALEAAVRFAATVRGGATVLAVTHGASLKPEAELLEAYAAVFGRGQVWKVQDAQDSDPYTGLALDEIIRLGLDHDVTLHFLDFLPEPTGSRGARRGHLLTAGTNPVQAAYLAPRAEMRQIAGATGGVFVAEPDLLRGLRRITERERGRHVLGFYSDRPLDKRELRGVRVASRSRGVTIESGRAYDVRDRAGRWSPGTILVGDTVPAEGEAGRKFVPFRLDAVPAYLDYESVGTDMVADLSLHVRVLTADGRHLTDAYHFFRHAFPQQRPGDRVGVLAVRGWIEADPGQYRLEALFRNPRSGREVMILHELELLDEFASGSD